MPNSAKNSVHRGSQYVINLSLTREQLEQFYAGHVNQVWARDTRGVSIQFPLHALRPFITHAGVRGRFRLQVSADQRLTSIEAI